MSEWGTELLDLDAYLKRIEDHGTLEPTVDVLRRLHRAHTTAIPFENLDVMLGRGVSVDLEPVQDKLVRSRRGGYCGEQNLLFAAVLARIGFTVTRTAARVRMGSDKVNPRTHVMTLVEAGGTRWLADVGFGAEGLTDPIALHEDEPVTQNGWSHRVMRAASSGWLLQALHAEGWFDLYGFTEDGLPQVDLAMANHFVATSPRSPFTRRMIVQRPGATRHMLMGTELTTSRADGFCHRREVPADELGTVMSSTFGIDLTAHEVRELVAQSVHD